MAQLLCLLLWVICLFFGERHLSNGLARVCKASVTTLGSILWAGIWFLFLGPALGFTAMGNWYHLLALFAVALIRSPCSFTAWACLQLIVNGGGTQTHLDTLIAEGKDAGYYCSACRKPWRE